MVKHPDTLLYLHRPGGRAPASRTFLHTSNLADSHLSARAGAEDLGSRVSFSVRTNSQLQDLKAFSQLFEEPLSSRQKERSSCRRALET